MAKKTVSLFEVKDKEILILKENLSKLTSSDNEQIAFYVNTLGFEVKFVEPEPKKKNYFTIEKATEYIKANDKKSLKEFVAFKEKADNLFLFVGLISLIIYIYFLYRNYTDYKKYYTKDYSIRLFGSIFVFVGTLCLFYFQLSTIDFDDLPSNI